MSDRRERVARAMLRDHLLRWDGTDEDVDEMWADTVTQQEYLLQADAAIAAMQDAEPTEAEIDAAREMWFRLPDDMTADECMRRVLIAARKARP